MSRVTTKDIANAAGVSQATVSVVLNNKKGVSISAATREKVLATASRMGYAIKPRVSVSGPSLRIGVIVPTLSNMYYPVLLQNMELYAQTRDISLLIKNTLRNPANEALCINELRDCGVDGIIALLCPKTPIPTDIPFVIVGEKSEDVSANSVSLNSFKAGYLMADHLIQAGHTRIAYISSPLINTTSARQNRLYGIQERMAEAGLAKFLDVLIDTEETEQLDNAYELNCGRNLTERLLASSSNRATAIIAVNDMTAAGALSVLLDRGIAVPKEMAVCGFDNLAAFQALRPQLTSVDQMAYHGAKIALDILAEDIRGTRPPNCPIHLEYEPHLFVRGSTVLGAN